MESNNVVAMSWVSLALAIVLLVAPWIFGFAGNPQLIASLWGGVFVAVTSGLTIAFHRQWESWGTMLVLNMVAGAAIFMAPLLYHYNDNNYATWFHMVGGIAIAAVAVIQLWRLAPNSPAGMAR